jgi:toxin ParE1/3/4
VALERFRLPAAEDDLDGIWLHIAADSPQAADRLIDRIEAAEQRLLEFPGLGRERPELLEGVRSWPVGPYLILYRVDRPRLVIIRVVHGARDLDSLMC